MSASRSKACKGRASPPKEPNKVQKKRAKGLQAADAEDLAQTVLISVSKAIERWEPDGPAKFRTWLKRITDNAILNALTRGKPDRAAGSTTFDAVLSAACGRDGPDTALLELEYRREIFHWAAANICDEFSAATWQAFWLTAVESKPAEEAGRILGRNRGSIYAARSRVMRRLLQRIDEFEAGEPTS